MVQLWHRMAGTIEGQARYTSSLANCLGQVLPTSQGNDGLSWPGLCCVYLPLAT